MEENVWDVFFGGLQCLLILIVLLIVIEVQHVSKYSMYLSTVCVNCMYHVMGVGGHGYSSLLIRCSWD